MQSLCAYLLVLLAYAPGLWIIARSKTAGRLPLVTFGFFGLFLFNAVGSILVMGRVVPSEIRPTTEIPTTSLYSPQYVVMLVLQAIIFYIIAGPYWRYRAARPAESWLVPTKLLLAEKVFPWLLAGASLAVVGHFFVTGGRAVVFDLAAGSINYRNILSFREATYGRPDFWFYRLGFLALPGILAAYMLLKSAATGRLAPRETVWIGCCLAPSLLLGEKSGILYISAMLIIAYTMIIASREQALWRIISPKVVSLLLLACVPTAAAYALYYRQADDNAWKTGSRFVFRIVGVYSESLAAVVPLVHTHGQFGGRTLPTVHGLIPHDRFNLESAMHAFLWHGGLQDVEDGLPGCVPVCATGEGYVNFGWGGFVLFSAVSFAAIVAVQELLLRLPMGLITSAMTVWYAWLSMTIATTSIFATLISIVHTGFLAGAVLVWLAVSWCERLLKLRYGRENFPDPEGLIA